MQIGFYQVDVGFEDATNPSFEGAKMMAIGDLNNDKLNDFITVTEDQTAF